MTRDNVDDGMVEMTDAEITGYLASQDVGVLGLPAEDAPVLRPLSFGYDGDDRLYFLYIGDGEGRKVQLSRPGTPARFLVYTAETAFNWRSVLLTGTVGPVAEADVETAAEALREAWRPDAFEQASSLAASFYQFDINDRTGIKQLGLPPGFDE
jgi:nitroimidazol reductase NimA-like FMN-containing flavoprotein (pyridoxamine 5'-phosphate oxidase superfamily)